MGAIRRIPPPVNFPSIKSETTGNNPNINLVPSGGQGWVKEKSQDSSSTITQQQTQGSLNSSMTGPLVDSSSESIGEKNAEKVTEGRSQNQQQSETIAPQPPISVPMGRCLVLSP